MPDLLDRISISPNKRSFTAGEPVVISVTVTNQGDAAAAPFWVDLFINPSAPPTQAIVGLVDNPSQGAIPMSYLINVAYTDAQFSAADAAIGEIDTQLPGLIALSAPQRKRMNRMGEKSESFCRQALNIVGQNPQIVPPNIPAAQAIANLKTLDRLRPLLVRLTRHVERLSDSDAALGNDIMKVSLSAYGLLKMTGRTEGLEGMRKEIGVLFARAPRQREAAAA